MLRNCRTAEELNSTLSSLPRTLNETYERILVNIDGKDRGRAHRILQWLSFSTRPLSLEEAAEVLSIDFAQRPKFDPNLRLWDPWDLMSICPCLLTVTLEREIQLAHSSVKEYLVSDYIRASVAQAYSFDKELADEVISSTCLAYLMQFTTHGCIGADVKQNYPLAIYAGELGPPRLLQWKRFP